MHLTIPRFSKPSRYLLLALTIVTSGYAQSGVFKVIDCPGATSTQAVSLNNKNWVVGTCVVNNGTKSFARLPNGEVRVFTVEKEQTLATDINDSNVITGYFVLMTIVTQGFLNSSGVITTFGCPGATSTIPLAINAGGSVTGTCQDSTGYHGFVRDSAGNFSTFDPPGSSYTVPRSINSTGEVAGFFYTGSAATQAFVRDAAGNITTFAVPNAYATTAFQINDSGYITGSWTPLNSFSSEGYTRDPAGNFTTFAAPNTGSNGNTYVYSINSSAVVTGYAAEGSAPYTVFGFTQSGSAVPVEFQEPNANNITESLKINDNGVVAGWYSDATGDHGFLGRP
jgi:hypothetical protein